MMGKISFSPIIQFDSAKKSRCCWRIFRCGSDMSAKQRPARHVSTGPPSAAKFQDILEAQIARRGMESAARVESVGKFGKSFARDHLLPGKHARRRFDCFMPDVMQRSSPRPSFSRFRAGGAASRKSQTFQRRILFSERLFCDLLQSSGRLVPAVAHYPDCENHGRRSDSRLLFSGGTAQSKLKKLPREAKYLLALILLLFVSAVLSPVWKGGAISHTIDFAKVFIVFLLVFVLVTDIQRLRRIIFVQSASVMLLTVISIAKGHNRPRLEGVIGGIYSNPNDLAFAIVLSIPFCLAFLITSKGVLRKCFWATGILSMLVALFLTASRAGFIDMVLSGAVCLWYFGVRGRRPYLIVITAVLSILLLVTAGKKLIHRFEAISDQTQGDSAYGSYEARKYLMYRSLEGIEHYPVLGVGVNNFINYSGMWHQVHMTYLEIAVEGGIPSLNSLPFVFCMRVSQFAMAAQAKGICRRTMGFSQLPCTLR